MKVMAPLSYMALIWWLSDRQLPMGPEELLFPGADKLVHGVEYCVLARLWFWALGMQGAKVVLATFLISLGWGALDEWHQTWVVGRDGNVGDFVADAAGALLAALSASGRRPRRIP